MKIAITSMDAEKKGEIELSDFIFACKPRADILQRVVVNQLASRRAGTHQSKTRGQVHGSMRKIMRQKGSGSARHSTRKVNIFRGGGTAHGPAPRNYAYRLPKKIRKLALRHVLSSRAAENRLVILDKAECTAPKTATVRGQLTKLGLFSALIVDHSVEKNFALSVRNIPNIHMLPIEGFNAYDVLSYDHLVLTQSALAKIEERLK